MSSTEYGERRIKELLAIRTTIPPVLKLIHALLHQYYRAYKKNKRG
jgi:hypothetical protein